MRWRYLLFALVPSVALAATTPSSRPTRGYVARACGFDMDDDGTVAEAGECDVCDGTTGTGPLSVDYDGDTSNETEVYIDYTSGVDSAGRGGPSDPYASISYAMSQEGSGEIAYCFTGTTDDTNINPPAGASGNYTRTKSGSEEWNFQYPSAPLMIVGWDTDNDGSYPPYDTDDSSVVDLSGLSSSQWLWMDSSYLEVAHFETTGSPATYGSQFVDFSNCGTGNTYSHLYFHDIELDGFNRGLGPESSTVVFISFTSACGVSYVAVENIQATNMGGFFTRGGAGNSGEDTGPYADSYWRFKGISATVDGANNDSWIFSKPWGELSNLEYLDIEIDMQAGVEWTPISSPASGCFGIAQCVQDVVFRNNYCEKSGRFAVLQTSASGYCSTRPLCNSTAGSGTGCVLDGNEFLHNYGFTDDQFILTIGEGAIGSTSLGDVYVTNNVLNASTAIQNCIWDETNDLANSTFSVVGNTWEGTLDAGSGTGYGCISIDNGSHENWEVYSNIFGMSGNLAIYDNNSPTGWAADYNVYPTSTGWWAWGGSAQSTLANWQSASGDDGNARQCAPTYAGASDFHLGASDTCAIDYGTNITSYTSVDYDGDSRPTSNSDIGADEYDAEIYLTIGGVTVQGVIID